jgi:hypothetical protein
LKTPVEVCSITSVAQLARAAVSKTAGWGFKSLLTCEDRRGVVLTRYLLIHLLNRQV